MMDAKDTAWFNGEVRRMQPALFRVSYSMLGNVADCEDAAASAVLKAYEKLPQLHSRARFGVWLMRILRNECIALIRLRARCSPLPDTDLPDGDMRIPDIDLYNALMRLGPDTRAAVVLHYLEGYGVGEVARILGVPVGTVKSRLSRARARLKALLGNPEDSI